MVAIKRSCLVLLCILAVRPWPLYASSFESCLFKVKILKIENALSGDGHKLGLKSSFIPKSFDKNKKLSAHCSSFIGKTLKKPLKLKSKQFLPYLIPGREVSVDYSHFSVDKKDPELNIEVWKVVGVKTVRSDHGEVPKDSRISGTAKSKGTGQ